MGTLQLQEPCVVNFVNMSSTLLKILVAAILVSSVSCLQCYELNEHSGDQEVITCSTGNDVCYKQVDDGAVTKGCRRPRIHNSEDYCSEERPRGDDGHGDENDYTMFCECSTDLCNLALSPTTNTAVLALTFIVVLLVNAITA